MTIAVGDRVKLSAAGIAQGCVPMRGRKSKNGTHRTAHTTGRVIRVTPGGVTVVWDGQAKGQRHFPGFLERA